MPPCLAGRVSTCLVRATCSATCERCACGSHMPFEPRKVSQAFGAREKPVSVATAAWSQPSWPLACPVRSSRKQWLHAPKDFVTVSRPLGQRDQLFDTMMAPGRKPPPSARPRPHTPNSMLCCGIDQDAMKDIVSDFVSIGSRGAGVPSSKPAAEKHRIRPPWAMATGYSDGYIFLPPGSPGKAQLNRSFSQPDFASTPPSRLHTAPHWASGMGPLDGTERPFTAQSEPSYAPPTPSREVRKLRF